MRYSISLPLAVLWIRFILIWIRIRGSVSDDYGSGSGSGSWPNLDKKSKFRNFLAFFWKEKFCGFPLSIKKRLKYSNPWTFRRNLAFSALHLLKFCSKMNNFWQIWLLDPDPLFFKRIRIREKITDPTDPDPNPDSGLLISSNWIFSCLQLFKKMKVCH